MTSEEFSCRTKLRHRSMEAALRALSGTIVSNPDLHGKLHPYLCRFCKGWHLGKSRPELLQIRRLKRK